MSSRPSLRDFELDLNPEDKGANAVVFLPEYIRKQAEVKIQFPYCQFPVDFWATKSKAEEKIYNETQEFFENPLETSEDSSLASSHPLLAACLMMPQQLTIEQNQENPMPLVPTTSQFQQIQHGHSFQNQFYPVHFEHQYQNRYYQEQPEPSNQNHYYSIQAEPAYQNQFNTMQPESPNQIQTVPTEASTLCICCNQAPRFCLNRRQRGWKPAPETAFPPDLYSQVQDKEPPFTCLVCNKSFNLKKGVRRHYTVKHAPRPNFLCRLCNSTFASKCALRRHVRTACLSKMRHHCVICDKSYSLIYHRNSHMKKVHGLILAQ